MSRPLRIQYPGAWYHVMNRGLNRRRIFHNDTHRQQFLILLADIHHRYGIEVHAYCLMNNHYHLLLHTPQANLSRAMRHLDGVYTQKFNHDTKRDGALFRGRYKAILIEAENYMLQLSRYIHLNPVSAKICAYPCAYKWSSYSAYINRAKKPTWLYRDECLLRCSEHLSIKMYQKYVEHGNDAEFIEKLSKAYWPSVLGTQEWIKQIKKFCKINSEIPASKDLTRWKPLEDIDVLIQKVINHYGLNMDFLKKRGNRYAENKPRNFLIYLAMEYCGYESKKIADKLETINANSVRQIKMTMQKKLKNDKFIAAELNLLKEVCGLIHQPHN